MKIHAQQNFLPVELAVSCRFVEAGVNAFAAQQQVVHANVDLVGIEFRAGVARGAEDAAPIRVGARQRRLHQRRVGNGARHAVSIEGSPRPHNFHGDQLGSTLAVARNHARERLANQRQSLRKPGAAVVSGNHRSFRKAAGQRHEGVVGGGVAVYGDAIEGIFRRPNEQVVQHALAHGGVRGDERKHGGHARMNHPRPFGNAGDVHDLASCFRPHHASLGNGVSGQDGVGDGLGVLLGEPFFQMGELLKNKVRVERDANDSCRCHQDLARVRFPTAPR